MFRSKRSSPGGNGVPHEPRMPVALPDVRSLAQHINRDRARRRDSRADRLCPGATAVGATDQALQQRKLSLTAEPYRQRTTLQLRTGLVRLNGRLSRTILLLVSDACLRFRDCLLNQLEIAMGLETVHPEILDRLNKRMTLDQFSAAAEFLRSNAIDLRVFILVQPPFMPSAEALHWTERSLDFAFACGATVATLIPTRGGQRGPGCAGASRRVLPARPENTRSGIRVWQLDCIKAGYLPTSGMCTHDRCLQRVSYASYDPPAETMNLTQQILPQVTAGRCEGHS